MLFSSPHEVTIYYGESVFVYGVSSVLHFAGFITAMYVFRFGDSEQLQSLVERVFLMINVPNRLFYVLWLHMMCGIAWLIAMTIFVVVSEHNRTEFISEFLVDAPNHSTENLFRVGFEAESMTIDSD